MAARGDDGPVMPEGSPFEDFFREFQDRQDGERPRRGNALGSGFVISDDGYIVTNNHVIENADEIMIEFYEGFELPAEVIGTDPNTDIALLLKVEPDNPLRFVSFGSSEAARVGDWVMAMGNPLGQGFSVSAGIVSAKARALRGTYDDYIQTDAAINRGNSGGPALQPPGRGDRREHRDPVAERRHSIGIGFAMSSTVVENVIDQLQEFGETRRGWLGVRIQDVDPDMVEAIDGLETASGRARHGRARRPGRRGRHGGGGHHPDLRPAPTSRTRASSCAWSAPRRWARPSTWSSCGAGSARRWA